MNDETAARILASQKRVPITKESVDVNRAIDSAISALRERAARESGAAAPIRKARKIKERWYAW